MGSMDPHQTRFPSPTRRMSTTNAVGNAIGKQMQQQPVHGNCHWPFHAAPRLHGFHEHSPPLGVERSPPLGVDGPPIFAEPSSCTCTATLTDGVSDPVGTSTPSCATTLTDGVSDPVGTSTPSYATTLTGPQSGRGLPRGSCQGTARSATGECCQGGLPAPQCQHRTLP